jgi:hypothetical protein
MALGSGGIIGPNNPPNTNLASGIWTLADQQKAVDASDWPTTVVGQSAYTTPGTYSWIAPEGVYRVSVVAVGGGGGSAVNGSGASGGSGGGLGWRNNIEVVPGQSYDVVVGAGGTRETGTTLVAPNGGDSWFKDRNTVVGYGGLGGGCAVSASFPGGKYLGDGGGYGGAGGQRISGQAGGGGGAGGYTGNGGDGATAQNATGVFATDGAGGGGGGGGSAGLGRIAGSGGGVGILGQGASGLAGGNTTNAHGGGGFGGSGGGDATNATQTPVGSAYTVDNPSTGGAYGGGGCGSDGPVATLNEGPGGDGAVRIIWGTGRAFPSTNTGDM